MSETEEDARQRRFLETPQGEKGSGAVRYAAAMYFLQRGQMSERDLEFYRARSKVDGASPITQLLAESKRYIGALDFAGRAEVLNGITRWSQGAFAPVTPKQVPMLLHLAPALAAMKDRPLAALIEAAAPLLRWVTYPYEGQNIGERFPQQHAFATLIGEYGPYKAPDFDLGLFLIAPHTFYRDHHHKAPELYAPLTGPHGWRFAPDAPIEQLAADVPVWNPSYRHHATLVGDVPFLAFYCWTRDVNEGAQVIHCSDWKKIEG